MVEIAMYFSSASCNLNGFSKCWFKLRILIYNNFCLLEGINKSLSSFFCYFILILSTLIKNRPSLSCIGKGWCWSLLIVTISFLPSWWASILWQGQCAFQVLNVTNLVFTYISDRKNRKRSFYNQMNWCDWHWEIPTGFSIFKFILYSHIYLAWLFTMLIYWKSQDNDLFQRSISQRTTMLYILISYGILK